jgi:hypothetical protein
MLVTFITFVCQLWLFQHNCDCDIHERPAPILKVKMLQPNLQSEVVATAVYVFQNTGAHLLRFMNLYCCENPMFSPLCCHLLRVSVGSGSLHLVAVLQH